MNQELKTDAYQSDGSRTPTRESTSDGFPETFHSTALFDNAATQSYETVGIYISNPRLWLCIARRCRNSTPNCDSRLPHPIENRASAYTD